MTSLRLKETPDTSPSVSLPQAAFLANPDASHYPPSWYLFGSVRELGRGPVAKQILGKRLVAFLTESGKVGVLAGGCVHMGSDLGGGCVVGETLRCSLHHWQFGIDGQCTHIPTTTDIPDFAKQTSYPAIERHGNIYFFNGPEPLFPLPFFDGLEPDELVASPPFIEYVDCPWYMMGANAVDVQHFAITHDRQMQALPEVDYPTPYSHRSVCRFTVVGKSLGDRLTRRFGGPLVHLAVTDWSSTMVFAHSTLARAETFGMVSVVPVNPRRTMVHVTVMVRRSRGRVKQIVLDPVRARIRRSLIREFLRSDVHRLANTIYSPHSLIDIDRQFSEYFDWLGGLIR